MDSTTPSRLSLVEWIVGGPEEFPRKLESLGPTFVKIGQFLALRPDLVPQEYCDALMRLFDRVDPFPWDEARKILTEDLGRDPSETFASVDSRPIAAGSLAQVHLGRLHDGTLIAIKIRRPGIEQRIQADLVYARKLFRVSKWFRLNLPIKSDEVLDEIELWLKEEIHFEHELRNLEEFYQLTRGSAIERTPMPYPHFCSDRILVTEYIEGVPFGEILGQLRASGTSPSAERIDLDPRELAKNLFEACLTQIFQYQFFHADLHPGNLFALNGNKIGFVDFGLCSELDETIRGQQLSYFEAVYRRWPAQILRSLEEVLERTDETDLEAFRSDAIAVTERWAAARDTERTRRGQRSPTGSWLVELMRLARKHHLLVPTRVLSLYRTLLTADSVATELDPDLDFEGLSRRFFARMEVEEISKALDPEAMTRQAMGAFNLWRDGPVKLRQVLIDLTEGRLTVNSAVEESSRTRRQKNRRTRLIAACVLSIGLASLAAAANLPTIGGVSLRYLAFVALIIDYMYIVYRWRLR